MYDDPAKKRVGVLWGRGQRLGGHVLREVLRNLDRRSPEYGATARSVPTSDGWVAAAARCPGRPVAHGPGSAGNIPGNLRQRDDSRRSGRCPTAGTVPAGGSEPDCTYLVGTIAKVDGDGRVFDVSGGTGPHSFETYASKIRGTYTWGTGAFLLQAVPCRRPIDTRPHRRITECLNGKTTPSSSP